MNSSPILLGVNIDHIATVRQARGTTYPCPVQAALAAEQAGADGITVHLREDRRHIQDRDVRLLVEILQTRMNLEMAITEEILTIAEEIQPAHCCLVPEKRNEVTTEGGLDVVGQEARIKKACTQLAAAGIRVSLFIDPCPKQLAASYRCGAPDVEIHTGSYADAKNGAAQAAELVTIAQAVEQGQEMGLVVNAGHGLHYHNVQAIARLPGVNELNIGHAIIARALMVGMDEAVRSMRALMIEARGQAQQ